MNRRPGKWNRSVVLASFSCIALLLSACGTGGSEEPTSDKSGQQGTVEEIAALVPDEIAKRGALRVAHETYPPAVITPPSGGESTGWEVETARALSQVLGLKYEPSIIPFDNVIPSLQSNRYDIALGEIAINKERTAVLTMVQHHIGGRAFLTTTDNRRPDPTTALDVCGVSVAVLVGSLEQTRAEEMSQECVNAGQAPIAVTNFKDQASADLALSTGRTDYSFGSDSQVAYLASKSDGKFKVVPLPWQDRAPSGAGLADTPYQQQMAEAVKAGFDHLIKSGKLQAILDEFNGGLGSIEEAKIFPKGS